MSEQALRNLAGPGSDWPFRADLAALFDRIATLERELAEARDAGVKLPLDCPACGAPHIDQPQPEKGWTNPPHRTHECQDCGHLWRPYEVATYGVENPERTARLAAEASCAALVEALKFYADPFNQRDADGFLIQVPDFYSECDFGERSRTALASHGERGKALLARLGKLESLLARWAALDGGAWNPNRYAADKADLEAETTAALTPEPDLSREGNDGM